MIKSVAVSIFALSTVSMVAPAVAAGNMKPGLWEMTTQSPMMKNMPKISPEQIEQANKMGIDISQLQSGAIVNKVCITKEMAERDEPPPMSGKEAGCEVTSQSRTGATYRMEMACSGAEMKGKGSSKTVFSNGGESFSSTSTFDGTVQGVPVNDHIDTSGRWVNADCGSVKPIRNPLPNR